jgi:hypothetical protein
LSCSFDDEDIEGIKAGSISNGCQECRQPH